MGGAAAFALIQEAFAARAADLHAYSSAPARDALMCRRLYLDICGRLPTREEAESYIASRVGKRPHMSRYRRRHISASRAGAEE